MAKFNSIVADPPWSLSDRLTMSKIKRGAESHYDVLSDEELMKLDVEKLAANDSVLVLWVPSSKLQSGLDVMKAWGFRQTQTFIWVKTKNEPLSPLQNLIKDLFKKTLKGLFPSLIQGPTVIMDYVKSTIDNFDVNEILTMNMGRWFRQTHEIALVGVRGKIYSRLENKSQRSVLFAKNLKHSTKPDELQDRLLLMLPPSNGNRHVELFARRVKPGVTCVGLECPATPGEDIRDSISRLIKQ